MTAAARSGRVVTRTIGPFSDGIRIHVTFLQIRGRSVVRSSEGP